MCSEKVMVTSTHVEGHQVTNYSTRDAQCPADPTLPDALNRFYAGFEDPDLTTSVGQY